MEGSLSKWTNVMKGWQYRWFVLDDNSGLLSYYTSKEKMMRGVRRGCVRLKGAIIGIDDEDDSTFTITVDHKTFHFQARDAVEREKWVRALEDTIFKHGSRMKWDNYPPPPTIKDFQYKVTEADAYLQLMIEQIKNLEENISRICDPEDKTKCQTILEQANIMLDNVKHSIVLLQIAKNTAHPVNGLGLYQLIPGSSTHNVSPLNRETSLPEGTVTAGVELGAECRETTRRQSRNLGAPTSLAVPDMSYSSSEGEEDFFDANDYPSTGSVTSSPSGLKSFDSDGDNANLANQNRQQLLPPSRKPSGKPDNIEQIDDDSLYDDESDDSLEIDSNVSVIRHLLSQVKIGMDLTKVVLPTFILERRSLLEMYADYFAHPDLFLSIPDAKDPKERMVQVVKWYLSSYHAGRKSAVAKKPYNPILGEIFRCHWNVPESYHSKLPPTDDTVQDGPISWCTKNHLVFLAEQVSHHPPISAFYAEHYNKRISFNAHVYTKSKFLGLSVCVYNIGQGVVSVLDHDEEYMVTFPNGYGRSILTVPWIELGGSTVISCRKTGYYCNVEFITKPFYGNKKHRISAEVFGPDDKKPFLTISGEWNGIMEAKSNDKDIEDFVVDVNKLEIVKKQVRPISQQDDNESRKVWKNVTLGLRVNDIDKATAAKQNVEQRQRDEAKERKDNGTEWHTKLFHRGPEESWHFMKPLRQRLTSNS